MTDGKQKAWILRLLDRFGKYRCKYCKARFWFWLHEHQHFWMRLDCLHRRVVGVCYMQEQQLLGRTVHMGEPRDGTDMMGNYIPAPRGAG